MNRFLLPILFAASAVTGLSAATEQTVEPDPALRTAVDTYWEAIVARDWATAYTLEKSTQHAAEPIDPTTYYRNKEVSPRFRALSVESINQSDASATSIVSGTMVLPLGPKAFDIPRRFEADWEQIDEGWYHVGTRVIAFPPPAGESPDTAAAPSPEAPGPDGTVGAGAGD